MRRGTDLTRGNLPALLARMTLPSIGGGLAFLIFNLTDTYFVSRLGTNALAAMGFTFPVVMIVGSVAMGLGMGASSVIARAVGAGDRHLARRTATDGLLLAMVSVAVVSAVGSLTIDPLFRFLGAEGETLELVRGYMSIWYLGAVAAIVPPVGDGCMRATGEMVLPLFVMCTCAVANAILDPILIFGLWGAPEMGIRGAALATVMSRVLGMTANLCFLHFRCRLLEWNHPPFREILASWRRIVAVGAPAALVRVLMPVSRAAFVSLAAGAGGTAAVAALAAGSRIEAVVLILQMAFSIALLPAVGQNWGARRFDRVDEVRRIALSFAFILGGAAVVLFLPLGRVFAGIFSSEPDVVAHTARYLVIIAIGHAGLHVAVWTGQSLNAVGKSVPAALLSLVQAFVFQVPFAFAGRAVAGFSGMLWGIALGQILSGILAWRVGRALLAPRPKDLPLADLPARAAAGE